MPTRKNPAFGGGFNSPGFAEAAQGLGALFAPPSGTDAAGFANAAKTKQETQFLTDLYTATQNATRTGDPRGMDPWVYAVGRNFGNTYAGHGMSLQTVLDKQASENAAALGRLRITDATERYKVDSERAGRLDVQLATPVASGATRMLPPKIASQYNLPHTQVGVVEVKPGEVSYLPDGRVLQGPAIPLTFDQARGNAFGRMPGDMQQQAVLTGDGVVAVLDPTTNRVVQMSRAEASARGLRPVDVTAMQQGDNAIALERAKGVSVGRDGVVFLSPREADARGLPQTLQGPQELKPNTSLVVPSVQDGVTTTQTLRGADKPETVDQVKAQQLLDLRQKGVISDEMMAAILAGNVELKIVEGPNGPQYVLAQSAVGMTPGAAPGDRNPVLGNYTVTGPDGRPTLRNARYDTRAGMWVDAQTGTPLPPDVGVTKQAQPQGGLNDLGASVRNDVDKQLLNINMARGALVEYAKLAQMPGTQGVFANLAGTLQNVLQQGGAAAEFLGMQRQQLDAAVAANAFAPEVLQRFQNFNPNIPAAQAMRQMVIALVARATTQDAQVSNRDIDRIEQMIGGGDFFSNPADTIARLGMLNSTLDAQERALTAARTPGSNVWGSGGQGAPGGASNGPRVIPTPSGPVTIERVGR